MSSRKIRDFIGEQLNRLLDLFLKRAYLFGAVILLNVVVVSTITVTVPYPLSAVLGAIVIIGSVMLLVYYVGIRRLGGIIPVSDDLAFVLVHMRCLVTGNPPLVTLFQKVGEADFYRKKYRDLYSKITTLTKNWGYSLPESLRLVSKETPSKVEEQLFQRFSAIVATGGDVREYLRLEYNTLFSEYKSGYSRMIETLRVVLGIYTTLIGALTFLVATLMLLGMIFGGAVELVLTAIVGMALALLAMSSVLYFIIRRPLFECRRSRAGIVRSISVLGACGMAFLALIFTYLVITLKITEMEATSLYVIFAGLALLPAGLLVKFYEGRIIEYDMFYPAFLRSYGEHLAVVPNMLESLKPLLMAELGKLKKLLVKVYAGLLNKIDPRIIWTRFAEESGSDLVARTTKIFIDTIELGGDTGEAGSLLSDHVNEFFRLRLAYLQVFRTFEITLYAMHAVAIVLLIFVGGFINAFASVVLKYAMSVPAEFAGLFSFFTVKPVDISLMVNISTLVLAMSNTIALLSVNPGSRHAVYYFLAVMLIMTGVGVYLGSIAMESLLGTFFTPFI
ncbi:MAG: type II secretion system F family protein [Desulfurococcaceae archaeon]